jgi:hypothetical protein
LRNTLFCLKTLYFLFSTIIIKRKRLQLVAFLCYFCSMIGKKKLMAHLNSLQRRLVTYQAVWITVSVPIDTVSILFWSGAICLYAVSVPLLISHSEVWKMLFHKVNKVGLQCGSQHHGVSYIPSNDYRQVALTSHLSGKSAKVPQETRPSAPG